MRSSSRSAHGARLRPGTVALSILVVIVMSGCVNRGSAPDAEGNLGGPPSPALGEAPAAMPSTVPAPLPPPTPAQGSATSDGAPQGAAEATTTTTGSSTSAAPTPTPASRHSVVVSSQRDGAEITGPGYADLRALVVERLGSTIRVTVDVGGDIPTALKQSEVIGLGVDFSRPRRTESDAQLFIDGGPAGWRAYLQTADGFVDYPGDFAFGGSRFVLEVPVHALPDPLPSVVTAFLDWSTKEPAPAATSDAMPDEGPLRPTP